MSWGLSGDGVIGGRVIDEVRLYTFCELTAVGLKSGKSCDVSELSAAEAGCYGFCGLDPHNRGDYALRFSGWHDAAVEFGTELAAERTGEDAKLTDDTATWKVAVRDARECPGALGQLQHAASCTTVKYFDCITLGNLTLFCPVDAFDVARENCNLLLDQLN